jgi:hypothetical protein
MIGKLGKVATILAAADAREIAMHMDVDAFHAPSECHDLVRRGEEKRLRLARRHAEAVARRPFRIIARELKERGCPIDSPRWQRVIARLLKAGAEVRA